MAQRIKDFLIDPTRDIFGDDLDERDVQFKAKGRKSARRALGLEDDEVIF